MQKRRAGPFSWSLKPRNVFLETIMRIHLFFGGNERRDNIFDDTFAQDASDHSVTLSLGVDTFESIDDDSKEKIRKIVESMNLYLD